MTPKIKNPILVAEISANHNGSIIRAKKLIDTAKKYGADAVKLQTYEPSSMTINKKKNYLKIRKGIWKGKTLWDLYKMAQTPFHWQKELFQYAKKKNILCFSTPFDFEGVDLLESINCPIYKIASFEITDIPLIRYVAQTKKPIIISTGMSSLKEIDVAYKTAISNGSSSVTILYCVSNYPSKTEDFNLKNIITLKERYKCRIGFSDHSTNNSIGSAAAALGAEIFEKHIALEGQKSGADIAFSLKGKEILEYRNAINDGAISAGNKNFIRKNNEMKYKFLRRSLFVVKKINKGDVFNVKNIKALRPNVGVPPEKLFSLIGKKANFQIKPDQPITKKLLSKILKNK